MINRPASPVRLSRLVNGIVIPPTHLELIAVDHCNISCRSCNHASPLLPAWFADPETIYRDFSIVAKHYRPKFVKVLGGEPLLHKHLDKVIRAARKSGISNYFSLTTNAVLLDKASDDVWEAIDEIEVSVYPGMGRAMQDRVMSNITLAREKAAAIGKKITIYTYDQFRATFCLQGSTDQDLIAKVHAACKVANFWGCHAVRDGYFYKCPQSIYAPILTRKEAETDRLTITDGDSFSSALYEFVNSPIPLSACAYCAGTVGRQEQLDQLPRAQWRDHLDKTLEEIVDYDWLERSLIIQDSKDDCKKRMSFRSLAGIPLLQCMLRLMFPVKSTHMFLRREKGSLQRSSCERDRSRKT